MTADDEEEFYFWEMAVAKAPGMFRPYKGKPPKTVIQEKKDQEKKDHEPAKGGFVVGVITGAVLVLVVRRMLCGRSPHLRG